MHPRVVAERRANAQVAMNEAVSIISDRFGVQMPERPAVRITDTDTAALFDLERTATFLNALVVATEPAAKAPAKKG